MRQNVNSAFQMMGMPAPVLDLFLSSGGLVGGRTGVLGIIRLKHLRGGARGLTYQCNRGAGRLRPMRTNGVSARGARG